jgi:FkbM family methyltransferase
MHGPATILLREFGRLGRALPDVKGRGRIALGLSALLLKAGANPCIECTMKAGHRLRLDCRVQYQCWALFSGQYDDALCETLCSFLRPGGTVLDVGANIGCYTVPMAIRAKSLGGRVVAIEPVPSNVQWLRHNLAINECSSIVDIHEIGLSDQTGNAEIVLTEDWLGGGEVGNASLAHPEFYGEQFVRTPVKLDTLDRIWPSDQRLDVVKLDIEGFEINFLKGGKNTLAAQRPVVLLEVNRLHYSLSGVDFDTTIPSLLPPRYVFVTPRNGGFVQLDSLAQCAENDVFALPVERLSICPPTVK